MGLLALPGVPVYRAGFDIGRVADNHVETAAVTAVAPHRRELGEPVKRLVRLTPLLEADRLVAQVVKGIIGQVAGGIDLSD